VQRMLGHAKASMTMDVYADLFDEDPDSVAVKNLDVAIRSAAYPLRCSSLCGAKGIRTPDLLDANETIWAFVAPSCVGPAR
jgi:hypothetical protein